MPQTITYLLTKDMSHDGQTLSRVANAAMPPTSLCHRYAIGLPIPCSPSTPIHSNVGVSYHAPLWYSSNGEYHPPKSDFYFFISWDVEMQSLGDLQVNTTHQ